MSLPSSYNKVCHTSHWLKSLLPSGIFLLDMCSLLKLRSSLVRLPVEEGKHSSAFSSYLLFDHNSGDISASTFLFLSSIVFFITVKLLIISHFQSEANSEASILNCEKMRCWCLVKMANGEKQETAISIHADKTEVCIECWNAKYYKNVWIQNTR